MNKPWLAFFISTMILYPISGCNSEESDDPIPGTVSSTFDASFNSCGFVVDLNDTDWSVVGSSIALDADGNIIVAGESNNKMTVWRYNADGTPDSGFGNNGILIDYDSDYSSGYCVAVDINGRILVAGTKSNGLNGSDRVVWRFNSDGTPDISFGINGIVTSDNGSSVTSILQDESGSIIVMGAAILRYNIDGTSDVAFGIDGVVANDAETGFTDYVAAVTIDSQRRLIVVGERDILNSGDYLATWRYNSDGTPDTTFGDNGVVLNGGPCGHFAWGESVILDSSGKILVFGYGYNHTSGDSEANYDMVILRYNVDGSLDTTFGTGGVIVNEYICGGNGQQSDHPIIFDADGKILITGRSSWVNMNPNMVIWRYNSDGSLDTTFGLNGVVAHNSAAGGDGEDYGNSITLDNEGKILVAGVSFKTLSHYPFSRLAMAVWRYCP